MSIRKKTWIVHCIAECRDCGWRSEHYRNAQALAAIHAKKHGHLVEGDVGLAFSYDGRKEVPDGE